ncbi:hypothetical protein EGW08_007158 [Elysia chlorotica]|uniref:BHLH domain-containing protein n=1 Tax=Elysia chlorotica TaxID=188477 RepID=A0A433TU31_ELYCH|nr:hypothetical protein EGW08_007158 [Elysia chlorotica]
MIAAAATKNFQQVSSFANSLQSTLGDELPSLSCDLGDVNSTEFEQLLLQGMSDPFLLDFHHFPPETVETARSTVGDVATSQTSCDLSSFFLEDVARPRDLHLSIPGEQLRSPSTSFVSSLLQTTSTDAEPSSLQENLTYQQPHLSSHFYPSLSPVALATSHSFPSTSSIPLLNHGDKTPPHSGGVTPQYESRAASPAWSESSGNLSCSSSHHVETGLRQRARHHSRSSVGSTASGGESSGTALPRHKRPSHKRAEVKRRDKIKGCLEDMKDAVPSLHNKGKLSESAILIKASEYIHHLKDGHMDRGKQSADLRREIECLSKEIHSFQENLPAAGLKEESESNVTLDDLYQAWLLKQSQNSTKFCVFSAITSKMWESFKEVVGPVLSCDELCNKAQEWQTNSLSLPVLRKEILAGLLQLSRQNSMAMTSDPLKLEAGTSVDAPTSNIKL